MRISSRAIIFKEKKVLLIYRERDGEQYYVFPGGKIEDEETKEECVIRECKEELGIFVNAKKLVYKVMGEDFIQYFFLCEWIDGEIGTGNKEEYDYNRKGGIQIPKLVDIEDIKKLNVVSPPIVQQLLADIEKYDLDLDTESKEIIEV